MVTMITHAYAQTVMHRTRGQPWRMLAQLLATSQHPNTCELSTLEHVGCVMTDCSCAVWCLDTMAPVNKVEQITQGSPTLVTYLVHMHDVCSVASPGLTVQEATQPSHSMLDCTLSDGDLKCRTHTKSPLRPFQLPARA